MLQLIKYELKKTLSAKLILLGVTVVAQAVFLYGYWAHNEDALLSGALLLFFIATTGIALMGVLSLVTLHRDMNTRQGYMLFMTPNSCYKILGAKVLECGFSILIAGAFYLALGMLDFSLLLGKDSNQRLWDILNQMLRSVNQAIVLDAPHVSALVFSMLANWLCTVTTAYLADVVSSALLNGKKANWIVTFLLFIALNYGISLLLNLIPSSSGQITFFLLRGAVAFGLAGVMYVVTARLMDRYLSV